jgi:hypothetical protein
MNDYKDTDKLLHIDNNSLTFALKETGFISNNYNYYIFDRTIPYLYDVFVKYKNGIKTVLSYIEPNSYDIFIKNVNGIKTVLSYIDYNKSFVMTAINEKSSSFILISRYILVDKTINEIRNTILKYEKMLLDELKRS